MRRKATKRISAIKKQIANNIIDIALIEYGNLIEFVKSKTIIPKRFENDIILLFAQFNELRSLEVRGTESTERILQISSKIRSNLLESISDFESIIPEIDENNEGKNIIEQSYLVEYNFHVNRDLCEYSVNEQRKLLESIEGLLNLGIKISISRIEKGSIKIYVKVPKSVIIELDKLIKKGVLKSQNVIDGGKVKPSFIELHLSMLQGNLNLVRQGLELVKDSAVSNIKYNNQEELKDFLRLEDELIKLNNEIVEFNNEVLEVVNIIKSLTAK